MSGGDTTDMEALRVKFLDERAAVQARIEEIQGDERSETGEGQSPLGAI